MASLSPNFLRVSAGGVAFPLSPSATSPRIVHDASYLYNDGDDGLRGISFVPGSPTGMRQPGTFSHFSVSPASGSLLSPRSPHVFGTAGSCGSILSNISTGSKDLSPNSAFGSGNSSGNRSAPGSPGSPLPPLSPRGQRLADSEDHHKAKCLNRIVEKRRKASDGTADIVQSFGSNSLAKSGHARKVSFASDYPLSGSSLVATFKAPGGASPIEIRFSMPNDVVECLDSVPSSPVSQSWHGVENMPR